jgi:TatD DNase family protein
MLIDSHCHLASHRFAEDELDAIIARATAAGVKGMVSLATCLEDIEANLLIAERFPQVRVCLGIHPCDVHHAPDDAIEKIASYVDDPRVIAIGETGLDYYHPAPEGWDETLFHERQRSFLDQHFQLAARSGLGIVIHTRDRSGTASFDDAIALYQRYASQVRALFHCFIGNQHQAQQVIDLGGLLGFGGVTTFKSAADVLEVASKMPAGRFVVETDSPYLAPVPHRGQRNEPAFIEHTAARIALARGESLAQFHSHCAQAARQFFPKWPLLQNGERTV